MASADQIAAYCTGAAGIITAIGGILIGWRSSNRAAAKVTEAIQPVARKVDDVGRQVGQHSYEMRDRASTEALRGETIQRGVEALVAAKSTKPSEQSVWNYVRQAKASQNEAQLAAAQALHALEQVQLMLGQTPTVKVPSAPLGPIPPPVPPLEDE